MLNDIESGAVNCVIVKDLSRLGRNSIDTGYYIEQYIPQRKVRFIAVNEGYDTDSADGRPDMMIALRNMVNEAYAADISKKITAAQRQMMKDGKYVGALPPYGYLKDSEDCHKLVIDPEAAEVVRQIFAWAAEGMGLNTIVTRLNEAGIMTPSHRRAEQGLITNEKRLGSGSWQTFTVNKILHAEFTPATWYRASPKSSPGNRSPQTRTNTLSYRERTSPSSAASCSNRCAGCWIGRHNP